MKNSLILLLLGSLALRLAAAEAPPPPAFNLDSPAPAAGADPLKSDDKGDLPNYEALSATGQGSMDLAAPQISEEQIIKNALEIAYQLYHAEDYQAAGQTTHQILEKYPKRKLYWVLYLDALCCEHQNLYEKAIEEYQLVKKDAPHSTYANSATFRIGLCEVQLGRDVDAEFTLHDVIDTHPRSEYRLQAYVHLGNLYRRARQWKEAEHIYQDLIRLYPDTMWAYTAMLYIGECYSYSGKPEKSISVYEGMQRTASVPVIFKAQAQLRIGEIHLNEKNWQEAITAFRTALRDYSDVPGIALSAEEKIAQAQEARRSGNVTYKNSRGPVQVITDSPADKDYQMKQEHEAVPY